MSGLGKDVAINEAFDQGCSCNADGLAKVLAASDSRQIAMAMYTSSYINKALATRPEGPRHEGQMEGEKTIQPAVARCVINVAAANLVSLVVEAVF